jgi:polar amino acid transport system substrate-binding protein
MTAAVMLILVILAAPTPIAAQEPPSLTVVTEEFAPYNYTEDGRLTGISTEVVEAIIERAGLHATIAVYPWARAYNMALRQANVVIYSISMRDDRIPLFKEWIGPIAEEDSPAHFWKLTLRKDIKLQSLDDAKSYRIGVIKDWLSHQFLVAQGFSPEKLEPVGNYDVNFKKLMTGRVDLVVANDHVVQQFAEKPDQMEESLLILDRVKFYMAVSKGTSDAVTVGLKAAFEALKAEGRIQAIWARYGGGR